VSNRPPFVGSVLPRHCIYKYKIAWEIYRSQLQPDQGFQFTWWSKMYFSRLMFYWPPKWTSDWNFIGNCVISYVLYETKIIEINLSSSSRIKQKKSKIRCPDRFDYTRCNVPKNMETLFISFPVGDNVIKGNCKHCTHTHTKITERDN